MEALRMRNELMDVLGCVRPVIEKYGGNWRFVVEILTSGDTSALKKLEEYMVGEGDKEQGKCTPPIVTYALDRHFDALTADEREKAETFIDFIKRIFS